MNLTNPFEVPLKLVASSVDTFVFAPPFVGFTVLFRVETGVVFHSDVNSRDGGGDHDRIFDGLSSTTSTVKESFVDSAPANRSTSQSTLLVCKLLSVMDEKRTAVSRRTEEQ
jgi:hypothetical protein